MTRLESIQPLLDNDLGKALAIHTGERSSPAGNTLFGGIVGGNRPSTYSRSPALWNAFFGHLGLDAHYLPLDVGTEDRLLRMLYEIVRVEGFLDLTVTDPYKEAAFRFFDETRGATISSAVRRTGVINHVTARPDGELSALNTDGTGMVRAVETRTALAGRRVLVIGAGSSAKSIAFACVERGAIVAIANRTASRAERLVYALKSAAGTNTPARAVALTELESLLDESDVVISAISSGLPLNDELVRRLRRGAILADTRYGAKSSYPNVDPDADLTIVDGLEMLYYQFEEAAIVARPRLGVDDAALDRALAATKEGFLPSAG